MQSLSHVEAHRFWTTLDGQLGVATAEAKDLRFQQLAGSPLPVETAHQLPRAPLRVHPVHARYVAAKGKGVIDDVAGA